MNLLRPAPLPFDFQEWKTKPFPERVKMLCQAWAVQGYGTPPGTFVFYFIKMVVYVGMWLFWCSFSHDLGTVYDISVWWLEPEALLKLLIWSILYENLGFGCGSGPLTGRFMPPIGGVLYYLRPGTVKVPLFPRMPIVGSDTRSWFDVFLYVVHILFLVRSLLAPDVTPDLLYPTIALLPLMGLLDRTLFLSARAEHYWMALICFLFPEESISGAKLVWLAIWFWAATSKLNHHFPSVVTVMVSNSPVLQSKWLKKTMYKRYPEDLNPSTLAKFLAHLGTVVEYTFPLILILGTGGLTTNIGLMIMLIFHVFITSSIPMGVPLEWNVVMVYGALVLFGGAADVWIFDIHSLALIFPLLIGLLVLPVVGNIWPRFISFLLAMRYYAGNWAYSVYLFRSEEAEEKLDSYIKKVAPAMRKQLLKFYEPEEAEMMMSRMISFRMMHLHGRAIHHILPKAVDDIENYIWQEGEIIAGQVLGWNFGDGHLHQVDFLNSLQKRCNFEPGELRCIFVESQPIFKPRLAYKIVDAANGVLDKGEVEIHELLKGQPWPET